MSDVTKLGIAVLVVILLAVSYFFVLPLLQKPVSGEGKAVEKLASLFSDSGTDLNGFNIALSSFAFEFEENTLVKLESSLNELEKNKEIKSDERLESLVKNYKELIELEKKQSVLSEKIAILVNKKLIDACQDLNETNKMEEEALQIVLTADELNEKLGKVFINEKIQKPLINVDSLATETANFSYAFNRVFDSCLMVSKEVDPLLELEKNA